MNHEGGQGDRRANMSNDYGRHSSSYDSRFEPDFQEGDEAGWEGRTY